MLTVQRLLVDIEFVRLVDANIEHVPLEAFDGAFKLPVTQTVRQLVAIAQRVVGWANTSLLAYVDSHETVRLVLSSAVVSAATDKALNGAPLGHRAGKSLHNAESVRVLPQSAPTQRSKIVKSAFLVEVMLENELSRWLMLVYVVHRH